MTAPRYKLHRQPGAKCESCGATDFLESDHRMPRRFGGAETLRNIHVLCLRCHREKSTLESIWLSWAKDEDGLKFNEWFDLAFPSQAPLSAWQYLEEWNSLEGSPSTEARLIVLPSPRWTKCTGAA